jgi:amino acid adenylation domain-containing protein
MFASQTVAGLARQLARLISALAAAPGEPVTEHDLLSPDERELVLNTWNGAALAVEDGIPAHRWFERQAAATPDAVAAECGGEPVTYAALDRRAEAVAQVLAAAGAGDGTFVGIAVRRSIAMLAAVLGTLKAGATYVPLDLSHPAERIAMILEDTGAPLILTDATSRELLPPTGARPIEVADLPDRPTGGFRSADLRAGTTPEPVAYVTYTSGSTGRPKGILMPHRAVSNLVAWQLDRYRPWPPGYRTLQFASLSFDVSFQEIFSTFASGGTLVLITEAERRDLYGLVRLLNRERIQRLFIPSVALQQVAEGYRADGELPSTLETVIAGSEQLMITDDLSEMFSHLPGCRLHNEYGPSETHVTTEYPLSPDPATWPARVPIGRPIANSRVYVLDDRRRPVPPGSRGEVYIGGPGLARGYLERPEQTAAAFIPDPLAERAGARLYRTGDIARHLPDGNLEFLGRADSQVKIRGFRVELGEIEASLDGCPGVRSAFVTVHGADSAHRRLVAYVVPGDGASPGPAELREFLARRLPEYMLPAAFMFLDGFPLTVNGKIDQRRLPAPQFGGPGRAASYIPPRDDTERMIAAEVTRLLGTPQVGLHDSFFELGGYSLLAAELVRTVRKRFAAELPLADFYQQPTVAGLAGQVRASQAQAPSRR